MIDGTMSIIPGSGILGVLVGSIRRTKQRGIPMMVARTGVWLLRTFPWRMGLDCILGGEA